MEWTVRIGDEEIKLQLPAQLTEGQELRAVLKDGTKKTFTWEPRLKTLFMHSTPGGLERCFSLRTSHLQSFSFEASCEVVIEASICPVVTIRAALSPLASGEAARQSCQEEKGTLLRSPMTGKVLQVIKENGSRVEAGEALVIIEAMKMENKIFAPKGGTIEELNVKAGDLVQVGAKLALIQG